MTCKDELLDVLDKMECFNQRAGRELWLDKPKEIQEQDIADRHKDIKCLRDYINNSIKLPCEVGDKVFILMANRHEQRILEDTVNSFRIFTANALEIVQMRTLLYDISCSANAVGKTVFLTKAEAEAKLKENQECM